MNISKKILLFVMCIWGATLFAQNQQSQNQLFIGAGVSQETTVIDAQNASNNYRLDFQVGSPLLFSSFRNTSITFPYNIFYKSNTFLQNKVFISKGFFSDLVKLNWEIGANREQINTIKIYRRELGVSTPEQLVATVAKDVFEYEDKQTEAGILYAYRIVADGITNTGTEIEFFNFVQGVGYRNPTAVVTGNVSFEGGNPVKDVTLFAEAVGASNNSSISKSMYFKNARASTGLMRTNFTANNITLQSWANLSVSDTLSTLFSHKTSASNTFNLDVALTAANTIQLQLTKNNTAYTKFTLNNAYPSGSIDAFGNDIYNAISTISNEEFIHFSVALENNKAPIIYINGRPITAENLENAFVGEGVSLPLLTNVFAGNYITNNLEKVEIFDLCVTCANDTYLDEIRFWDKTLTELEVRRDYRRYLGGGESNLKVYLRGDEGYGNFLYDLSKRGFSFNENHVKINANSGTFQFSNTKPKRDQLGVFGVTDKNGNYIVSSISYKGDGESFEITPSFGVHEFNPAAQTLFLGKASSVVNKIDFIDVSSFTFRGKALYNVQNIFQSTEDVAVTGLLDYSYNSFVDANGVIYNKGEYFYEGGSKNPTSGVYEDGTFKRYPVIGVPEANIYIDGNLVFDEDNQPVVTDNEGNFNIQVPIGNHKIEVKKEGHTFSFNGRFPATSTFEFFEDQIETRYFIDETRVTLVGKVVGGKKEFDKPIGFGDDGKKTHTNFEGLENENEEIVSSNNNIGVASITLKGDVNSNDLDYSFSTNEKTGEFRVDLIPYQYFIKASDLKITSNTALPNILNAAETLDLREIPDQETSEYTTEDGTNLVSEPYHYVKSFRYNSPVTLTLLKQEYETELEIEGEVYDVSNLDIPIYNQKKKYSLEFEVSQNYVNKDGEAPVITKEYFTEGELKITNNLEISNESKISISENGEKYTYTFIAGEANVSQADGFKKAINVQYEIDGQNPLTISNSDFKNEGIILGGANAGGVSFATYAPQVPDIILRDPPGSNSFASIERGTSINFTKETSNKLGGSTSTTLYYSVGGSFTVSAGTPFFKKTTTIETITDQEGTVSLAYENTDKNVVSNTYTFNQTISTSDDPDFVGADGDLYIGNAKNMYYGVYNNLVVTNEPITINNNENSPNISINVKDKEDNIKTIYISNKKDFFTAEQPTKTFFMYSQKYIKETLIPELESLSDNFVPDPDLDPSEPLVTAQTYRNQADLWRKVIQQNEKSKFEAKNKREEYQSTVLANIGNFRGNNETLKSLVRENFFTNRSFDAGLGEFTNSIETVSLNGSENEAVLDVDRNNLSDNGFEVDDVGGGVRIETSFGYSRTNLTNEELEQTTNISYTLKDNDESNVLSVDVVNMFDGNGPVFITKGGATSCPYEGEITSLFYNEASYNANEVGEGGEILSDPTNKVYFPEITVNKTSASNVPESEGALFTLFLKNKSETQTDLEYIIQVDQLTLNGATTNVSANGVNVYIPFNETIEFPFEVYKSSASSRYNYEDIRVYLINACDGINSSDAFVDVSVEFKKSCSNVSIASPQDNWIFNINEAYTGYRTIDQTSNSLPITFTDFNTDFAGFQKIELQYRNASSSNWVKFATYYGSEEIKDTAGDELGIVIEASDAEFTYNWDIVNENIPDGNYEFRAVSYCTDNIVNTSAVVSGTINLNPPLLFGTPSPTDGILDVGEDIKLRFNEDILERITSSISVTGLKNQQEIDHSVSVRLDGTANQIELPRQRINNQSFTLQFWYKNEASSKGTFVKQEDGIQIDLDNDFITFSLGGETVTTKDVNKKINSSQYNFYSFVYENSNAPSLFIFENGEILANKTLDEKLDINTNASIFIGGEDIEGNIHDVRIWSQTFTPAKATVAKDLTLTGRELNLQGYWKLNEGHAQSGLDKAKRRNAIVNLNWDIKPKGNGYEFKDNAYLSLENVGFIQPTHLEDISLSFWIKPNSTSAGTIFSNGVGDDSEEILTNNYRNKWSLDFTNSAQLLLNTEGETYPLTIDALTLNTWSHVAISLKRGGFLTTYINGKEVNTMIANAIGGFSGNKILVGAKLNQKSGTDEVSNKFSGKLDELRFWNTARTQEQIERDRYFEIDRETPGLLLYIDFNKEETNSSNGPRYYHADRNLTTGSTYAIMKGVNTQMYVDDSPAIKPPLQFTNIPHSVVINGDEMIIQPNLTEEEWSLFEGEILNFSVEDLTDVYFNKQLSPVTWTALVNRQEIEWFTQSQTKDITAQKNIGASYSFVMDIINIGGSNQPFEIDGLPVWLQASEINGTVTPNTTKQITFTVDNDLAMGSYEANIFLRTASGFNDRLSLDLRVLTQAPDWSVNASDYNYSMNIIGKIKIDGTFSRDEYTKVGAFINGEPKGEAYLSYDAFYDSYFTYLTVYSNVAINEEVSFKIWDATNGKIVIAYIDTDEKIPFVQNEVLGTSASPKVFSETPASEQNLNLNDGWTWISLYAQDENFTNINEVFSDLDLTEGDAIKTQLTFANFEDGQWNGSLNTLSVSNMYKIKLAQENNLRLVGQEVDPKTFEVTIASGWNWLPFPIHRNISLQEALAFFSPNTGDVIKDQFSFAIYDESSGWRGTLNYLESGHGYMLKASNAQSFYYPETEIAQKTSSNNQVNRNTSDNDYFAQFSNTMSIVAEVVSNDSFSKVLIYDTENNLRGSSDIVTIDNKRISFITAFSSEEETLRFVLLKDGEEIDIDKDFIFKSDLVLGDLQNPVQLTTAALSIEYLDINASILYPNPFTNKITLDFTKQNVVISEIALYNTIGVKLLQKQIHTTSKTELDTSGLAQGIYLVKITNETGKYVIKKMVKK